MQYLKTRNSLYRLALRIMRVHVHISFFAIKASARRALCMYLSAQAFKSQLNEFPVLWSSFGNVWRRFSTQRFPNGSRSDNIIIVTSIIRSDELFLWLAGLVLWLSCISVLCVVVFCSSFVSSGAMRLRINKTQHIKQEKSFIKATIAIFLQLHATEMWIRLCVKIGDELEKHRAYKVKRQRMWMPALELEGFQTEDAFIVASLSKACTRVYIWSRENAQKANNNNKNQRIRINFSS